MPRKVDIQEPNQNTPTDKTRFKVGMDLPISLIEGVETLIFQSRQKIPREKRAKLTKSVVYELIIETALIDYEVLGQKSKISKMIIERFCANK